MFDNLIVCSLNNDFVDISNILREAQYVERKTVPVSII